MLLDGVSLNHIHRVWSNLGGKFFEPFSVHKFQVEENVDKKMFLIVYDVIILISQFI